LRRIAHVVAKLQSPASAYAVETVSVQAVNTCRKAVSPK
jgi:hypothetical protein